jgi:ABC-type Fe3+-hydroxamate transport system substrate-binding protein
VREVVDDLGRAVHVPQRPERLVSLVPNLTETLWWWHLADRVVGLTDHCVAPPRAFPGATRVRGTKNPDLAAIERLEPDLVVANEEENRRLDVERLAEAGVAVYVTRVRTVPDAAEALARLGDAVGRADAGAGSRQAVLRGLDQVRPAAPAVTMVCPIWRDGRGQEDRWWLVGSDTFAGDLLARCGFAQAVEATRGARYPPVASEVVAAAAPSAVLLPDEPYAFGRDDAEVAAGWDARVRHLDGTAVSWWGPRTPHALGDLARLARQLARPRRRSRPWSRGAASAGAGHRGG